MEIYDIENNIVIIIENSISEIIDLLYDGNDLATLQVYNLK